MAAGSDSEERREQQLLEFKHRQFERKLRNARRKAREAEGEIEELNITPMLDMMTIILVFLLKSFASSTISVAVGPDLDVPYSTSPLNPVEVATVTITGEHIAVGEKVVAELKDRDVPAQFLNPRAPIIITPLLEALKKEVEKQKFIAQWNPAQKFEGELGIVGDRHTPYKVLFSVLATAGQAELGRYRFIVLKEGQ